jgi:hypothetical protein
VRVEGVRRIVEVEVPDIESEAIYRELSRLLKARGRMVWC